MHDMDIAANILESFNNIKVLGCDNIQHCYEYINGSMENFIIVHFNIRSLQKHYDELNIFLLEAGNNNSIGCIVLSETWNITNLDRFNIPGYNMFYNNATFNKSDGVVMYIRSDINAEVSNIYLSQTTLLKADLKINGYKATITGIYRSNQTDVNLFTNEIDQYLKTINSEISVVIGDLNINILNLNNQSALTYINTMEKNGYNSIINEATRVTEDTATCIDHVFLNNKKLNSKEISFIPMIIRNTITDHYPLLFNIQCKNKQKNTTESNNYEFKKIDENLLISLIREEKWEEIYQHDDTQICTNIFYKKLLGIINTATKKIMVTNKTIRLKPWMTNGLLSSIRKRDKLKKQLLENKNNINLKEKYKKYRNFLTDLIKISKNSYYQNQISLVSNNYKKTWKIINEATNEYKDKSNAINLIKDEDGSNIYDRNKIADKFNNFFINAGSKITENIIQPNPLNKSVRVNEYSIFLEPTNSDEIIGIINSLKPDSSPGKDEISTRILKLCKNFISEPISFITNKIFETSKIPDQFKEGVVIPIYKSGKIDEMNNYRPITLINILSKIFEKCLNQRLKNFLNKYNIISKNQFGFQKNISTEHSLQQLASIIAENFDKNKKTIAIFLDLQKAFDTVQHKELLNILHQIGIRGTVQKLFKNYLCGRKQQVRIGKVLSGQDTIKTGIPQGTVLGPTLFLIFINGLLDYNDNSQIISYADDTVVICNGNSWGEVYEKTKLEINKIKSWLDSHFLKLNISKTKYIAFAPTNAGLPKTFENIEIINCDDVIVNTREIKYLGVLVDQHLKWQEHVQYINRRLRKSIYKFFTLRNILNIKTLLMVYDSLIVSVLRYGISVWGSAYNNAIQNLQITQNFILRTIFKKENRSNTKLLYTESSLLNLRGMYMEAVIKFVHKNEGYKKKLQHEYDTKNKAKGKYALPKVSKTVCQQNLKYVGIRLYNQIPEYIKLTPKYKFNRVLKAYITLNFKELVKYM